MVALAATGVQEASGVGGSLEMQTAEAQASAAIVL
jgi:hypothetical protein